MQELTEKAQVLRQNLVKVTNIRQAVWPDMVEVLYEDIDALAPIFPRLAQSAGKQLNWKAMNGAHYLTEVLRRFEVEVALLKDACQGGQRSRKVLEQQRGLERMGNTLLEEIAELVRDLRTPNKPQPKRANPSTLILITEANGEDAESTH